MNIRKLLVPLFTALMICGAYIRIPLPPVPITLQSLFIMVGALLLTPGEAAFSVLLWIFLGAIGLPVFTSGGGFAALFGPTGGYIFGMAIAMVLGAFLFRSRRTFGWNILNTLIMNLVIYAIGTTYLAINRDMSFVAALGVGVTPFLIGDGLKMIISSLVAVPLRKELDKNSTIDNE